MKTKKNYDIAQTEDADDETRCGAFGLGPGCMQPCARIGWFAALYSMAAFMTSTLSQYVTSQITTLERQFGFSSRQTGIILAANDMGYLICVLFASYTASRVHIPRSLGLATLIFGASGLICSLPHFIYGAQINPSATQTRNASIRAVGMKFGDICNLNESINTSCSDPSGAYAMSAAPKYVATVSLVIIVAGMMIQGFGKAPRLTFTLTYIDNNANKMNTGFYMGIVATLALFGPAVAFIIGGVFSRTYVTLEETSLTPRHPKWIGAWWLGYIVFGSLALLVSLPLFCFPRRLPGSKPPADDTLRNGKEKVAINQKLENGHHHQYSSAPSKIKCFNIQPIIFHAKEFLGMMRRLLTNPVYMCTVISNCFIIFMVAGSSAYSPKYLERQFHLPAFKANFIMGIRFMVSTSVGTFIGGYLTKRLKMTAMKALKFTVIVIPISLFGAFAGLFFMCDQPQVHNWPGDATECYNDCHCEENSFFPVCGSDGTTYYSPCTAGCLQTGPGIYTNCTCIPGGMANSGICPYGCDNLYPYVIASAIQGLFATVAIMPKIIIILRSVAEYDKPLAVGASSFMTSLLGWLLGPIVMGMVIDGICEIWDVTCDRRGRCLLYDNDLFRIKLHSFMTITSGISWFFMFLAYVYARYTGCLEPRKEAKELEMGEEAASMLKEKGDDSEKKSFVA